MRRLQGKEYHKVKEQLVPYAYSVTARGNICVYYKRGRKHYLNDEEKLAFNPVGLKKLSN